MFLEYHKVLFLNVKHLGQSIPECTKLNLWKTALKKFEVILSVYADHTIPKFLKAVFHKFYLVLS